MHTVAHRDGAHNNNKRSCIRSLEPADDTVGAGSCCKYRFATRVWRSRADPIGEVPAPPRTTELPVGWGVVLAVLCWTQQSNRQQRICL